MDPGYLTRNITDNFLLHEEFRYRFTAHTERVSIKGQDVEVESRLLALSKIELLSH